MSEKINFRIELILNYLSKIDLSTKIKNYYKGRNIIVTGGAGSIGSNLVITLSKLVGKKGMVTVLDNLSANKSQSPFNFPDLENVLFVKGDLRNHNDLKRVFRDKPSIVFHLAAFFANQNSVDYPEISADVDILGIIRLLDYSVFNNIEKFIYASSGCSIYGSYGKMPLKEDFISMQLTTPYQINKMSGEMYCNFYYHHYGLKTIKCRFFNSYGPGEVPGQYRNVIPNFIYWSMKKKQLPITGEGTETRDFTYVLDLVQGLIKSAYYEDAVGKEFNLASSKETKIISLAKKINKMTNNPNDIKYLKKRKWDTKTRLVASIELAKKIIDYKPIVKLDEGLKSNLQWFRYNFEEIDKSADFKPGISSALK